MFSLFGSLNQKRYVTLHYTYKVTLPTTSSNIWYKSAIIKENKKHINGKIMRHREKSLDFYLLSYFFMLSAERTFLP